VAYRAKGTTLSRYGGWAVVPPGVVVLTGAVFVLYAIRAYSTSPIAKKWLASLGVLSVATGGYSGIVVTGLVSGLLWWVLALLLVAVGVMVFGVHSITLRNPGDLNAVFAQTLFVASMSCAALLIDIRYHHISWGIIAFGSLVSALVLLWWGGLRTFLIDRVIARQQTTSSDDQQ
jgi:hypothetical protein